MTKPYSYVDLFCGCGGLALGFQQAGFELLAAVDNDPARVAWFQQYVGAHKAWVKDLELVTAEDILACTGGRKPDVLIGGPPSKPFAPSGHEMGAHDPQNLVPEFLNIALALKPNVILLDMVSALLGKKWESFRQPIFRDFEAAGYRVQTTILNAMDYGAPQKREHGYIVAVRGEKSDWAWPAPMRERVTLAQALDDLLPDLPQDELPPWLAELEYPATGAILVSGKNKNKWGKQYVPFDGPAFTLTESAGNRHRIRDYGGQWRKVTPECFRRLQGFPPGFEGVDVATFAVATPPPLARAVALAIRNGLEGKGATSQAHLW